jgi:hypothetical protein
LASHVAEARAIDTQRVARNRLRPVPLSQVGVAHVRLAWGFIRLDLWGVMKLFVGNVQGEVILIEIF